MGLFDSPKIFTTKEQLRKALFEIQTLDQAQRELVFQALSKEFDGGGITAEEIKKAARELREKKLISEIDQGSLLKLINE